MKKLLYLTVIAIAALIYQDANAQQQKPTKEEIKAHSEQLMQVRLQMLKEELNLTEAQAAAFEPVYREYRKMIQRVVDNKGARVKREDITNENALQVVATRLSNTINSTSIKQKYLLVFAKVIEPVQIAKLYRIDDKIARDAHKVSKYKEKN